MRRSPLLLLSLVVAAGAAVATPTVSAREGALHATLVDVHVFREPPATAKPGGSANCSNAGPTGSAFAYTGWKVVAPTTAYLTASTVPVGLGNVTGALQASFATWSRADAGVPAISVTGGGTATKASANRRFELLWGRTPQGSIAVTYTWLWNDGTTESDTVFNTRLPWFQASTEGDGCYETQPAYDVRNIATHEFGHTYGLDHAAGDRFETMYAFGYTGETLKWSLGTGDALGISSLY